MNKYAKWITAGVVAFAATSAGADQVTWVGGAKMYNGRTIVENALNSGNHKTLVAAVKKAELAKTLSSDGPFTVFAPTDDAFENLPDGTVQNLLKPDNQEKLQTILTYHVVPGQIDAATMTRDIEAAGGEASYETVAGMTLTAKMNGHNIVIVDEKGNVANIPTYDVYQSNGVIHVIDHVLLPS